MTVTDMEARLKFLELELERTLRLLELEIAAEAPDAEQRRALKIAAGKIMLELGGIQMRLSDPAGAVSRSTPARSPVST